jgi:hypothetical protein
MGPKEKGPRTALWQMIYRKGMKNSAIRLGGKPWAAAVTAMLSIMLCETPWTWV